jgi:hypothetical protein
MHARARRDVAARPVLRGDCGGQWPQTCRGPRIGHQAPAGPCGWPPGTRHAVSGDGLRLAPPHRHRVHARSAAGHRYRSRRARAGSPPQSPPASRPADRTLMPESPLTCNTAASPHGRPGRAPDLRTPGRPRPPCTPGHRTARVTTAISAPPVPGPDGMHARLSGGRRATDGPPGQPVRGRPWKADGAHRPSWRPDAVRYMSVDTATRRSTALHDDTRRDKKETARIAENPQLSGRFRRWWQVLGSNQRRLSRRFYRPLLPAPPHGPDLRKRPLMMPPAATLSAICTCARPSAPPILRTATYRPVQHPKTAGRSTSGHPAPFHGKRPCEHHPAG